jgi:glutamate-1-semialdehyde 2,1-aminomutase
MDRSETTAGRAIPLGSALKRLAARALRRTPAAEMELSAPVGAPLAYDVAWLEHNLPTSFRKGERCQVYLRVENRGSRHWHASDARGQWVEVVVYIGAALHRTARIPHDTAPGEEVLLTIPVAFPSDAEDGKWTVTVSFVEQNVAWFHERGMEPLVVDVRAEEPEQGALAEACAVARQSNWGMWQPSDGITRSRTGCRYPTFIEHAQGCRVRDPEDNEWIDYVMAGGAAVLGYAHPEVQAAIARQLASSAVTTLAHMLEIKVTEMLRDMIPCAEVVLFGKHGSDACTAAIRTARLHTGRRKVLYSGYHGWHDWYAETLQPKLRSPSEPPTLFRFDLNDASSFGALVEAHRGEIAAVILEPAAQAGTLDDPPCDADPAFLRHVADVCGDQGCVLIFDEIVTGFRYPHGSVQRATGVIPDLACLGKALGGGMPLSALVGRRNIMQTSLYAAYMPTFRGENYSLAAAVAALQIHQRENVPGKIGKIGIALKDAINQLSRDLNVRGEMIGVPFRMIYRFDGPDVQQRVLMRTLLQQELLQRGVLTYKGFMLPSLAHGPLEVEQTVSAFRGALTRVQEVAAGGTFVRHLDIPLF